MVPSVVLPLSCSSSEEGTVVMKEAFLLKSPASKKDGGEQKAGSFHCSDAEGVWGEVT